MKQNYTIPSGAVRGNDETIELAAKAILDGKEIEINDPDNEVSINVPHDTIVA